MERARETIHRCGALTAARSERTRERAIRENGSGEGYNTHTHTRNGEIVGETGAPGRDRMCNSTEGERGRSYVRTYVRARERHFAHAVPTTTMTTNDVDVFNTKTKSLLLLLLPFLSIYVVHRSCYPLLLLLLPAAARAVSFHANRVTDVRRGTNCCARLTTARQLRLGFARQRDWHARGLSVQTCSPISTAAAAATVALFTDRPTAADFSHFVRVSLPSRLVPTVSSWRADTPTTAY